MTNRERQATDGVTVPTLAAPMAQEDCCSAVAPTDTIPSPDAFETELQRAHPLKQIDLIAQAARQGRLCAALDVFPVGANRNGAIEFERWNLLSRLTAGKKDSLKPIESQPIEYFDQHLDERQRCAVSAALATPDVAMVAGLPGTGKSRVVTETVRQAAHVGWRVLLLSPHDAGPDHVLQALADCPDVWAYRCAAKDSRRKLPHAVQSMTEAEQRARYRRSAEQGAGAIRAEAENHRRERTHIEQSWPDLRKLALRLAELQGELDRLTTEEANMQDAVAAELADAAVNDATHPLSLALSAAQAKYHSEAAELSSELEAATESKKQIDEHLVSMRRELEAIRPLAEAKQGGRWWTWSWWRATIRGKALQTRDTLEAEYCSTEKELKAVERRAQEAASGRQALDERIRCEVVESEANQRIEKLRSNADSVNMLRQELFDQWSEQIKTLHESYRPKNATGTAVDEAMAIWRKASDPDQNCRNAGTWADRVSGSTNQIDDQLTRWTNVVAGPIADFVKDKHFQTVASQFDLLILEDADQLAESDFLQLGRWAKRWLLVGEISWESGRPSNQSPKSLLRQMWRHFHPDPSRLPFHWTKDKNCLRCQLRPIEAQHRMWVETENVADHPDIELRIVNPPQDDPFLAEVVFPSTTEIADAKQFVYRETDEPALQTTSCAWHWRKDANGWTIEFTPQTECAEEFCIELEHGVREWIEPRYFRTTRLTFDESVGWRRERITEWLADRLQLLDLQRSAFLSHSYRMKSGLCEVLTDLLFDDAPISTQNGAGRHSETDPRTSPVEFIPIPPLRRDRNGTLPREGAGLELDMKTAGRDGRLPKDLVADLPKNGFINIQEAQAVVRKLEDLVQGNATSKSPHDSVAVVALFAAQAELIRRYIQRSPMLRKASLPIEVGVPHDFRHREASIVLVSLTRSHARRAVSFGEEESHIVLAMTRARRRLILFGDSGTLVRRSQWNGGSLERLDSLSAAREKKVVGDIVRYLQGQARHANVFRVGDDRR